MKELVTTVASAITAAGVVLLWWQIRLYQREYRDDHERSRRENALQMMLEWAKKLDRGTNIVTRFVDSLDESQARELANERPFCVAREKKGVVDSLSSVTELEAGTALADCEAGIEIKQVAVSLIRAQAVNYLNMLEIVLTAWKHNIADREILREQFAPMYNPKNGDFMLERFRDALGGADAYPSIADFVQTLKADRQRSASRGPLGR
jgi:hypothetical protein